MGLAVGAANFAAYLKNANPKPTVAAGPPLVGVGLALAVIGSALLSAAACTGGAGRAAASPVSTNVQFFNPFPQQAMFAPGAGAGTMMVMPGYGGMMPGPTAGYGGGPSTAVVITGPAGGPYGGKPAGF